MSSSPKQRPKEKASEESSDYNEAIDELANLVISNFHDEYRNELEPFEVYTQKVRSQLHSNIGEFRSRFINGYKVLLEELRNKHR